MDSVAEISRSMAPVSHQPLQADFREEDWRECLLLPLPFHADKRTVPGAALSQSRRHPEQTLLFLSRSPFLLSAVVFPGLW